MTKMMITNTPMTTPIIPLFMSTSLPTPTESADSATERDRQQL